MPATQPLYTFSARTAEEIRDSILRVEKNGLIAIGIPNPNVGPGSDSFIRATAVANELAVSQANATVLADAHMPDTAAGADLDRWLAIFGLSRRAATGSVGVGTFTASTPTIVVTGAQLTDSGGLRYEVTTGGTYANGAQIPIDAVDTGKATNHANGDTLTWASPPPFSAPTLSVGTSGGADGLAGGADSEVGNDEPPRARLLALLGNPPKGGNSADIANWANASSPNVQACFVYPALLGPATVFFAVTAAPQTTQPLTSTSKNRDILASLVAGTIMPYVQGQLPEHAFCCGSSVANQPVDVAIQLALPSAPTASPPGAGGGWLDGTPWPQSISGTTPVTVTAVTNSTQFTVNADTTPTAGVTHITWISPGNWSIYSATVIAVSGSSGAYVITLDTPFPGIANGHYISPQCQNQTTYLAALLGAFATLGPGEWTSNATVRARAFRHPPPTLAWPYSLSPVQLKAIINAGAEVLDANWIYRSATTPTIPGSVTVNSTTGLLTSSPPSVLTPRNISFVAQ